VWEAEAPAQDDLPVAPPILKPVLKDKADIDVEQLPEPVKLPDMCARVLEAEKLHVLAFAT